MFTTRPELVGDFGMIASSHWIASAVGMSILERGGNAADAAVAAGFVLQIVEPHLNGPGGDLPLMVWCPDAARVDVVCGQGVAPAAATIERVTGLGVNVVPGTGLLPTVVPGAFGAWLTLLERYGTMHLHDVLQPAIDSAERGHPLQAAAAAAVGTVQTLFSDHWPTSAAVWLPRGAAPAAGSRHTDPDLADTYRRILKEAAAAGGSRERQIQAARDAWYRGFVAEAIGEFCASAMVMDSSGSPHPGLLTADDLAAWEATVEEPMSVDYGRFTVFKTGPWGQGPVFLQQLRLLEGLGLEEVDPGSADWMHLLIESGKLAFADREAWYGDPHFSDVPIATLTSGHYAAARRALLGDTASLELRPGSPDGRVPVLPRLIPAREASASGVGEPTIAATGETRGDTCHIDVVDRDGMMVSATPSGGWLQSSPVIPGLGFPLNTRGQMFWLEPGLPNSLRPRARPRTTLSPSLALRDGEPWLAFGTPGGDAQDQWSLQFFLNLVHGGMALQEAADAPGFHSVHVPSSFYPHEAYLGRVHVEDRFEPAVLADLRRRGHEVVVEPPWSEGFTMAVARDGDWLKAGVSPRRMGYAVGR